MKPAAEVPAILQPGGISRRGFLGFASMAAASAAASLLPGNTATTPARRIPTGFLGTSYSHFKDKHILVRDSADFDLVGLCEPDEAARRNGPAGARWLSREELFARAELVIVESAVRDHGRFAIEALQAGKDVHVEKPPSPDWTEFQEMIRLAREKKRVLQIGYMWRYNPGIQKAIDAAKSGWLGDVFLVRATMNTLAGPAQRREWAEFPGGAMFEQGCHLIDCLIRLMGRPTRIEPFLKQSTPSAADSLADNTLAVFEFDRAMGLITSAPLQPNAGAHRFFEIIGTNGSARVGPLEPPSLQLDLGKAAGPYAAGRSDIPLTPYRRYVDEFADLARAVRREFQLPVELAQELVIHESVLRACRMMR